VIGQQRDGQRAVMSVRAAEFVDGHECRGGDRVRDRGRRARMRTFVLSGGRKRVPPDALLCVLWSPRRRDLARPAPVPRVPRGP